MAAQVAPMQVVGVGDADDDSAAVASQIATTNGAGAGGVGSDEDVPHHVRQRQAAIKRGRSMFGPDMRRQLARLDQ